MKTKVHGALRATILFLTSVSAFPVLADPTYGFELNYTNDAIKEAWSHQADPSDRNNPVNHHFADVWAERVQEKCGDGCVVSPIEHRFADNEVHRGWAIRYKNSDFEFRLTVDPGVVEVITDPLTTEQIKAHRAEIERDIFQTAQEIGLRTDGATHLNIGLQSTFGDDVRALRNFMVDFNNHYEIALGGIGNDIENAPPIYSLPEKNQRLYEEFVRAVDDGRVSSVQQFAEVLVEEVYTRSWYEWWVPSGKYQALNVMSMVENPQKPNIHRVEIRAIASQESGLEMELLGELFDAKIDNIKHRTDLIPVRENPHYAQVSQATEHQIMYSFASYVDGCGQDPERYALLLPKNIRQELSSLGCMQMQIIQGSRMRALRGF